MNSTTSVRDRGTTTRNVSVHVRDWNDTEPNLRWHAARLTARARASPRLIIMEREGTIVDAERRRWRLFVEGRGELLAYVRRIAPTSCEAVDVLQEVGLRLLRQSDMVVCRNHVSAWCKSVAKHIVLHELRAARYERAKLAALEVGAMPDAWESERRAALRSTLVRELERMDPVSRDLLLRRYVLEQTSSEIARDLEWSPPAVRMRLMRIRDQLGSRSDGRNEESSRRGDRRSEHARFARAGRSNERFR